MERNLAIITAGAVHNVLLRLQYKCEIHTLQLDQHHNGIQTFSKRIHRGAQFVASQPPEVVLGHYALNGYAPETVANGHMVHERIQHNPREHPGCVAMDHRGQNLTQECLSVQTLNALTKHVINVAHLCKERC